jgi:GNAT superfamily N-acetyltransferase
MAGSLAKKPALSFKPLTPARWDDLEALFGPRGACGGCWCMWWRLPRARYNASKGEGNRKAFRKIVLSGETSGIIAYRGTQPVGWCAVAPRDRFPALDRSRVLAPVDDKPVWSITCFFVAREHRGHGITAALIRAAVGFARRKGARIMEAYPVDPAGGRTADAFVYTGLVSTFTAAGFTEVARRSPKRAVYRMTLPPHRQVPRPAAAAPSGGVPSPR